MEVEDTARGIFLQDLREGWVSNDWVILSSLFRLDVSVSLDADNIPYSIETLLSYGSSNPSLPASAHSLNNPLCNGHESSPKS